MKTAFFIVIQSTAFFFISCSSENNVDLESSVDPIDNQNIPESPENTYQTLNDSIVYQFINEIDLIGENTVVERVISDRTIEAVNFGTKDSISLNHSIYVEPTFFQFNKEDSSYVMSQVAQGSNRLWDLQRLNSQFTRNKYNSWCMEHHTFDWDEFRNAGFGCFLTMGLPIFNKELDEAIIYVGYQCHYTLGSGSIRKYKKVDGEWEFEEENNLWIS